MKIKALFFGLLCWPWLSMALSVGPEMALAQETPKIIQLPEAVKTGGLPLLEALSRRQSERGLADRALPESELSNLLWAAAGVNRPDGRLTVPTAKNRQEVSLYLVTGGGIYRYLPGRHALEEIAPGDRRSALGFKGALELIMVLDETKAAADAAGPAMDNASISAGAISQNVYLYCASAGLGTVVKKTFAAAPIAEALRLAQTQKIIVVQPVGYVD